MVPKEVKQDIALKEVYPTTAIPKEVDKSLEEFKEVVHRELTEVLQPMEDNHYQDMFILYDFEGPSCKTSLLQITVFNIFMIETRGRVL